MSRIGGPIVGVYYTTTGIFDSFAQALVNPVNTAGAMGAGLAKEFKHKLACGGTMLVKYVLQVKYVNVYFSHNWFHCHGSYSCISYLG